MLRSLSNDVEHTGIKVFKGTFSVMRITLSKIKSSLYIIDSIDARHQ